MFENLNIQYKIPMNPPSKIYYGTIKTREYGDMFMAFYLEKDILNICLLHFFSDKNSYEHAINEFRSRWWSDSSWEKNNKLTKQVFDKHLKQNKKERLVYVVLNGTEFQMKVWVALLHIPYGEQCCYGDLADMIGLPKTVRSVYNAVNRNNIAVLIPCHRVKTKSKDKQKYKWGSDLKRKILKNEMKGKKVK